MSNSDPRESTTIRHDPVPRDPTWVGTSCPTRPEGVDVDWDKVRV